MCRQRAVCAMLVAALALASPAVAQRDRPARAPRDPWAGSWRGALTTPNAFIQQLTTALADLERQETELSETRGDRHPALISVRTEIEETTTRLDAEIARVEGDATNITLTLVGADGDYSGLVTGFGPNSEIRFSSVSADDVQVTVEGATDTEFGPLAFVYSLTKNEQVLSGGGRVTLGEHGFDVSMELTRARRADVPQPQIEQRIGYFAGQWAFEYTGGEFPPLSIGTRSGTVSFTAVPYGPYVRGQVSGEVFGEPYEETWTIGFNADTRAVAWHEQLSTGQQLVSVGDWSSPIGITFLTAPVEAEGRVYVLKRLMQTTSDTAFTVTDEFSVDGGPSRRLGNGSYIRAE